MSARDTGGPAFPVLPPLGPDGTSAVGFPFVSEGMTLRDYFAAKAMAALTVADVNDWPALLYSQSGGEVSKAAYLLADVMLQARGAKS